MEFESKVVPLFWTGGWDSTFRLCDLVLVKKQAVKPFYVLDPGRESYKEEIDTIVKIGAMVRNRIRGQVDLLQPLDIVLKDDIPPNQLITGHYNILVKEYKRLGTQYEWLARYLSWKGLSGVELSVEANLNSPPGPVFSALKERLEEKDGCMVLPSGTHESLKVVFGDYHFPLVNTTKRDMVHYANRNSFYDIMIKTWFCHHPINRQPCGTCKPCKDVMNEGMRFRMPLYAKLRYRWKKLLKGKD
jgi:7-cyano-7-deazaguanine synthase